MALFIPHTTKRLTIPESDDWVEIRTALTVGMRQRIMAASMSVRISDNDPAVDVFAFRTATLKEIITAWSDPAAVTPEAIEALNPEIADWLTGQFDALAGGRSEQEKKASTSASSAGPQTSPPSAEPPRGPESSAISPSLAG